MPIGANLAASSRVSGPPKVDGVAQTASVGRVGRLALAYVRQGNRTVFGRTSCQSPWHLLPPIYLDETGSAYTLLNNPSGGLVGGDRLSIDLTVEPKAHVLISTPSANRVYRSLSENSIHEVEIGVGSEGILEWVPDHTIPFAGSRLRQVIDVKLAAGASVILWDAIASGRIARGERWKFTSLENDIRITTASGVSVREHYVLEPADKRNELGVVEEWDYVGSLFVIADQVATSVWLSLETAFAEILDAHPGKVLGGVSQPAAPGLVVKLVARSAPVLTMVLNALWGAVRQALWNLPPAILRKY